MLYVALVPTSSTFRLPPLRGKRRLLQSREQAHGEAQREFAERFMIELFFASLVYTAVFSAPPRSMVHTLAAYLGQKYHPPRISSVRCGAGVAHVMLACLVSFSAFLYLY